MSDEVLSLYALVLEDVFKTNEKEREAEKQRLESDIRNIKVKIKDLDERLMNDTLPIDRYNRLVQTMEDQETQLVLKHSALLESKSEFKKYLDFSISFLANVNEYYEQASPSTKKRTIGSIFLEKLTFDGNHYRTTRINELFAPICTPSKDFKKTKPGKNAGQSVKAPPAGLKPATLLLTVAKHRILK